MKPGLASLVVRALAFFIKKDKTSLTGSIAKLWVLVENNLITKEERQVLTAFVREPDNALFSSRVVAILEDKIQTDQQFAQELLKAFDVVIKTAGGTKVVKGRKGFGPTNIPGTDSVKKTISGLTGVRRIRSHAKGSSGLDFNKDAAFDPLPSKKQSSRGIDLTGAGTSSAAKKFFTKAAQTAAKKLTNAEAAKKAKSDRLHAQEKVTCYFHAEIESEILLNHLGTLIVSISREALKKIVSDTSVLAEGKTIVSKKIIVQIIARKGFNVIHPAVEIETDVPLPEQPAKFHFGVQALQEGVGEIWVLLRQAQANIAKLVLKPKVVQEKSKVGEVISVETSASEPANSGTSLHQLWIVERKTNEGVIYTFTLESPGLKLRIRKESPLIGGRIDEYVSNLYKQIEEKWISSKKDVTRFASELRAFGAKLFSELIPAELQQKLWEFRDRFDSIQVISTEPFIPWELVHLKDPSKKGMPSEVIFMGQMGLIRWLSGAGMNGWPPDSIMIRDGKVKYIIPDYPVPDDKLPEAQKEIDFLISKFKAQAVEASSDKVLKVLEKPGQFDLLHFAGHGAAESNDISNAALFMRGRIENGEYVPDTLSSVTASEYSNLRTNSNSPMVVINACRIGRAGYELTGLGGFADAFLVNGGAGAFVGALWAVGDNPARFFTETLYTQLLKGKNLSKATIAARKAAKDAADATWLAYVVYGHPHMKIKR